MAEPTLRDIYESLSQNQKELLHYILGEIIITGKKPNISSLPLYLVEVYKSYSEEQLWCVDFMIGRALGIAFGKQNRIL